MFTALLAAALIPGQSPATTMPSLTECLRACPPDNDPAPFLRTPHKEILDECRGASGCEDKAPDLRGGNKWRHTFHTAARFSIPRFGQCREPVEADGVVIYEGMRLTVNGNTGVYDLSFTATAPPTPVTLRLQLLFHPVGHPDEPVRLTLPPIDIDPVAAANPLRPSPATVRVSHRGFSELFLATGKQSESADLFGKQLNLKKDPQQVTKDWAVIRSGSARFGSPLPNSDEPGR